MENNATPEVIASSTDTVGYYISIGIFAFIAISAFFALIFGFKRGFSKSLVRAITMAIAAVGAFLVAANISSACAAAIGEKGLVETIQGIEDKIGGFIDDPAIYDLINSFDSDTTVIVISLVVSIVVAPIAFILLFYAFKLVTLLVFWLISAMAGLNKKHKGFLSRILGVAISLVQGAIITAVIILPLSGFASIADEAAQKFIESTDDAETIESVENFRTEYLQGILENPVVSFVLDAGGKDLFKTMTSVEYDGDKFCAYDEMLVLSEIYADMSSVSDWNNPTEKDSATIEALSNKISENYFTSTVVSGVLRGFSGAVKDGILVVNMEEPLSSLFNSALDVFATSTRENLDDDLTTVTHVYNILGKYNVLGSFDNEEDLRNALLSKHNDGTGEKTVVDYVVEELYKNKRTAPIVDSLTQISIKIMCESMGLDQDAQKVYDNVKGGVKDILAKNESDYATKEEYVADISKDLDATLKENDIVVDDATLNNMSEYIAENYSTVNKEELTDEDINKAILSYYNAYAEANPDFNPDDFIPEGAN